METSHYSSSCEGYQTGRRSILPGNFNFRCFQSYRNAVFEYIKVGLFCGPRQNNVTACRGLRVTYKTGFWIGCVDLMHLIYSQFETTSNTALSLFYTHYSSPLHTHKRSQSSLVVSWQQIYNSLTVTSNQTWSLLFVAIILQLPIMKTRLNSKLISRQAGVSKLDSSLLDCSVSTSSRLLTVSFYNPFGTDHTEHTDIIVKEACLKCRCLAVDILLFRAFVSMGMCLASPYLAKCIHVTIY
jgi:hypothetical protein